MTDYKSDLLKTLSQRGYIHQCTDESGLDARLESGRLPAYIGFDCTAPSLHVGSLIQIMILRHLQKCGHKPVVLLGGGTTRVGDPSGRDESRKLLTDADIERNLAGIRATLERFLRFGNGPTDAILVNNAEWLEGLNYISFLRDVGRHFSVNRMLTQDSVKLRLEREQNLSFLEFNYMILQAYDFAELHRRYGCLLQIGGSDQWGNIIMGIELHRRLQAEQGFRPMHLPGEGEPQGESQVARVVEVQPFIRSSGHTLDTYTPEHFLKRLESEKDHLFGLTTPLLTTASGAKMGKTANGAVWLDAEMLSPYEYWQFWRNVEDADTIRFLKLFTDLPVAEIEKLAKLKGAEINEAKKILATEATRLAHGDKAAKQAADTARKTFEEGETGEALPEYKLFAAELGKGMPVYELFRLSGLASSGGDAKRLIRGGGARVNDRKVDEENKLITLADFGDAKNLKLSAGRKKHLLVKLA